MDAAGAPGVDPMAPVWLQLQARLAERVGAELALGQPELVLTAFVDHVVVIGSNGRTTAMVVSSDVGATAMCMFKVRRWLASVAEESGNA